MEVFEAVRTVLAVREYADKPVPPEIVARIVQAGRLTGSSMNRQPWHFIVVEERDTLKKLAEIPAHGHYTAQAALAVVVVIEKSRFSISDASRAIQSMVLAAWEEGIGSNWVGFLSLEGVNSLLGIPAELDVLAIVPFGYPAQAVGKGLKRRKPLAEVVSKERYGQPFE